MATNAVASIVQAKLRPSNAELSYAYAGGIGQFHQVMLRPGEGVDASAVPVPGVILRARTNYQHFSIVRVGETLELNDVIKTAPDALVRIEFYIGGRVGINYDSDVKIVSERSLADASFHLRHVVLRKGGLWAKAVHLMEPLEIQTNGGVLGIKG